MFPLGQNFKTVVINIITQYFRYVVILVIIIVVALGYFFVLGPKYTILKEMGILNYGAKVQELDSKKQDLEKLRELKETYSQLNKAQIENLELILPSQEDIPSLFSQFESLALANGLVLNNISITKAEAAPAETEKEGQLGLGGEETTPAETTQGVLTLNVALSFQVGGGYDNLKNFLDILENNMRIVDLTSLSYTPETEAYSINLKTYYLASSSN